MIWDYWNPIIFLDVNIILNEGTPNIMPILKIIIIIYSRQKQPIKQQEIYIDQCNRVWAEEKTQLSKTWVLQTSEDKHREALCVSVSGPKLQTALHSQC